MQNNENNRIIELILKKHFHENYLRAIFNAPPGSPIQVNRDHEIGKYLFSMVRSCSTPVKKQSIAENERVVTLIMPAHENDSSRTSYTYFTAESTARINDYIDACSYLDFRMMVQTGNIDLKMDRKTVIEIYSNLFFGEDRYEMLKKQEYRKRLKIREWLIAASKTLGYK